MATPIESVVMDEVIGICPLGPALRCLIQLVREDTDGERDGDVLGVEEGGRVLPVETGRRDASVREPVERDVVEDVISCEITRQASLQDLPDEPGLAGAVAVVDRERRQIDG